MYFPKHQEEFAYQANFTARSFWWRTTICVLIRREENFLWKQEENSRHIIESPQQNFEYVQVTFKCTVNIVETQIE